MFLGLSLRIWGYVAAAALVAGLCYGIYQHGKDAGYHEGQSKSLDLDKQEFKNLVKTTAETLAAAQDHEKSAKEAESRAQQAVDEANSTLKAAAKQRQEAHDSVSMIPDVAIVADLRKKLGVKPVTDPYLSLYPEELRRADEVVTESSALRDQLAAHEAKDAAIDAKLTAIEQRLAAKDAQIDALRVYGVQMNGFYAKAFAAAQPRVPLIVRIVTLGIKKPKKIDLPDPSTLQPPAPAEKEGK